MDVKETLMKLGKEGNLRKLPSNASSGILDFTSNDYLGVASNKEFVEEFLTSAKNVRFSSSASRLLASKQDEYNKLENLLKTEYNRDALIFNSGYHANTGIIPALSSDLKTLIIADKLVHASIIDGIVLSRADFRRFPHNDLITLRKIVENNYKKYDRLLIVTESVFSMDGDSPDLEVLLKIKKEFPKIVLYIDEAHAFGLKGDKGLGLTQTTSSPEEWDIVVCPLGKAAASMGAFVVCQEDVKEFLINKSRSFIFSTALPPVQIKWTTFILEKIFGMNTERAHLEEITKLFTDILNNHFPAQKKLVSHIQPLIIGNSKDTINLSKLLELKGVRALPIRTPTVPAGTERIRFSLTAAMTEHDILRVEEIFKELNATGIYN